MYTKGDWYIEFDPDQVECGDPFDSFNILCIPEGKDFPVEIARLDVLGYNAKETEANAHLIASAPDLYEACNTFQVAMAIWQKDLSKAPNTLTTIFNETIGKAIAKVKSEDG